jgi:hypothetical protein
MALRLGEMVAKVSQQVATAEKASLQVEMVWQERRLALWVEKVLLQVVMVEQVLGEMALQQVRMGETDSQQGELVWELIVKAQKEEKA